MQDDTRTDLVCVLNSSDQTPPSEDNIVSLLESRYKRSHVYTRVGHLNLVVINPFQPLESLNDATLQSYADAGYRDVSEHKPFLQPHVYDIAARAYFTMRRTGEDQSIVLR